MTVTSMGTTATSNASWTSSQIVDPIFGVVLFRSATHDTSANIVRTNANSPAGTATAISEDPWFFVPETSTELTLNIALESINLEAFADPEEFSAAQLDAFIAFEVVDSSGSVIRKEIPDINYSVFVTNDDTLSDPFEQLLNQTFSLSVLPSDQAYRLTAEVRAGALGTPTPEPTSTFGTLVLGTLGTASTLKRKLKS